VDFAESESESALSLLQLKADKQTHTQEPGCIGGWQPGIGLGQGDFPIGSWQGVASKEECKSRCLTETPATANGMTTHFNGVTYGSSGACRCVNNMAPPAGGGSPILTPEEIGEGKNDGYADTTAANGNRAISGTAPQGPPGREWTQAVISISHASSKILQQMLAGKPRNEFETCWYEELPQTTCELVESKADNDNAAFPVYNLMSTAKECEDGVKQGCPHCEGFQFNWNPGNWRAPTSCFGLSGNYFGGALKVSTSSAMRTQWQMCKDFTKTTTTTAKPADEAAAEGDPHMTNTVGDKFDMSEKHLSHHH